MKLTNDFEEIKSVLNVITCSIEETWEDCHLNPVCTIQELHHILEKQFPKYVPNFDRTIERMNLGKYSETAKYTEDVITVLDNSFHWGDSSEVLPEDYEMQAAIITEMYMLREASLRNLEKTITKMINDTVEEEEDEAEESYLYEMIGEAADDGFAWANEVMDEGMFEC